MTNDEIKFSLRNCKTSRLAYAAAVDAARYGEDYAAARFLRMHGDALAAKENGRLGLAIECSLLLGTALRGAGII